VSFASEPGRDDGNLPPVNIVIPDDARELERDVLAYHRELRARRRKQRLMRLFRPFGRRELGGHAAILPLIATCVALSMLAGAMLSVFTISPASAPTMPPQPPRHPVIPSATAPATSATQPAGLTTLPAGTVQLHGKPVPLQSLRSSVLALVPADCDCDAALLRLADQAVAAHAPVYFVGTAAAIPQLAGLTEHYGADAAKAVYDTRDVLGTYYQPHGLTVLLVYSDATARVRRDLPADFDLGRELSQLTLLGSQAAS
jgi:hypothetical protein